MFKLFEAISNFLTTSSSIRTLSIVSFLLSNFGLPLSGDTFSPHFFFVATVNIILSLQKVKHKFKKKKRSGLNRPNSLILHLLFRLCIPQVLLRLLSHLPCFRPNQFLLVFLQGHLRHAYLHHRGRRRRLPLNCYPFP